MKSRIFRYFLIFLLFGQSPAFAVTIGEQGTGDATLNNNTDKVIACWWLCGTAGNVNRIRLHVNTPNSANGRVAIYNDPTANLIPDNLMVESASQPLVDGWNLFNIDDTTLNFAQVYWLSYQVSNDSALISIDTSVVINKTTIRTGCSYVAFPDPFGTTYTADRTWLLCMYATEYTPTRSPTPTHTSTISATYTVTPSYTQTYTFTPTHTPTATPSITQTSTISATVTHTPTFTPTYTQTNTYTTTPTFTATPTYTPTSTNTRTSTITPVFTLTITPTITQTSTISPTSTITQTSTISSTSTISPTSTISSTLTISPTLTVSPAPTIWLSATITLTVTPSMTVYAEPTDLDQVLVYPNPWLGDPPGTRERIFFRNLTPDATIRIYTISGQLVYTLSAGDWADNGRTRFPINSENAQWGMTSQNGKAVASGIYLYIIKNTKGQEKRGKVAIVR